MGNCITCTDVCCAANEESSSMNFMYQNRKRTNEKIKQELLEKQIKRENIRNLEEFRKSRRLNNI